MSLGNTNQVCFLRFVNFDLLIRELSLFVSSIFLNFSLRSFAVMFRFGSVIVLRRISDYGYITAPL